MKFHDSGNSWAGSSVRAYLNGTDNSQFFNSNNFTAEDKARIIKVKLSDDDDADSVFLLSMAEAYNTNYFTDNNARVCTLLSDGRTCRWWLRSPGYVDERAAYVNHDGIVFPDGNLVYLDVFAVRPAVWINLTYTSSGRSNAGTDDTEIKNSGSGCSFGFGLAALAAIAFIKSKRK